MTKQPYSYDDIFPERWLHAPDLDGRAVTLTITEAYSEYIENPKNHKKDDQGDLCGILSFRGTKREYVLSKQNAWILKALWGKDPAAYVGKRITLAPVPDSSGFTEHGTRILFTGSPDITNDLSLNLPGGKHLTFKKTVAGKQKVDEASVDAVTGEVASDAGVAEGSPATDTALSGDVDHEDVSTAAEADDDATEAESTADEAFLGTTGGKGALFDAEDPARPATKADLKHLADAVKQLPATVWQGHLAATYGKDLRDLTHDEAVSFTAWATALALT